jgi:peptide/nickel transport system ATP-binding protein/oligopeptide transport system ATP-binding protein
MTADVPLLQVEDLHTAFYTDAGVVRAVRGVSFGLHAGRILGLVGESGCGKTVTGLSILRLIPDPPGKIERGRILFQGKDLLAYDDSRMRRVRGNQIAMIFQEPMTSLNPIFTVGYQIIEVLRLHQKISGRAARKKAVEMFAKVGLPDPQKRINEYPHQMSGGMRQRVMIAMALCCSPRLIIADEPTTALDVTIQAQILELINRLKEDTGASFLLITHDLGVIAEMADHVAVMYTGGIVETASCDELFENPTHPYTIGLMQSIPRIDVPLSEDKLLQTIKGVVPSLLALPRGCPFQDRCPQVMPRCRRHDPPFFKISEHHLTRCWLHES